MKKREFNYKIGKCQLYIFRQKAIIIILIKDV